MIYANWRAEKWTDELNSSVQLIAKFHVLHAAVRHCWHHAIFALPYCTTVLYTMT